MMQLPQFPTLAAYVEANRFMLPVALDLAHGHRVHSARQPDGVLKLHVNLDGALPVTDAFVQMLMAKCDVHHNGVPAVLSTASQMSDVLAFGPKVFRPSDEECDALSEIEISVPTRDYAQPFPTFCVEFPPGWSGRRLVSAIEPTTGEAYQYRPIAVLVSHRPESESVYVTVVVDQGTVCPYFLLGADPTRPLEEDIYVHNEDNPMWKTNTDEARVSIESAHLGLNACLLLMANGFRRLASDKDGLRSRLMERARRMERKNPERAEASRQEATLVPELFGFQQSVNVRTAVGEKGVYQTTGRSVRPHWRRAHWRRQRYGVGLTQQKMLLIPHTMVRRDLFHGTDTNTKWEGQ